MSSKAEMLKAREAMAAALDAKLADMPEWQALRAIDRAIASSDEPVEASNAAAQPPAKPKATALKLVKSYQQITLIALGEKGEPITTSELLDYVVKYRTVDPDRKRAEANVASSLSKDERIASVPWRGGQAWWFAGRPAPQSK